MWVPNYYFDQGPYWQSNPFNNLTPTTPTSPHTLMARAAKAPGPKRHRTCNWH